MILERDGAAARSRQAWDVAFQFPPYFISKSVKFNVCRQNLLDKLVHFIMLKTPLHRKGLVPSTEIPA